MKDRLNTCKDFLLFRRLMTPALAQLLYWAFVLISLVGAMNVYHLEHNMLKSLQMAVGGIVLSRIITEFVIAFFNMAQNSKATRELLEAKFKD